MKQGTLITKVTIFALFLAVAAYLCASAWRSFNEPFSTVISYAYTLDDSAEVTGSLVRQEEVIPSQSASSIVDVRPSEGEKVAAGQTVAYLYKDGAALERKRVRHRIVEESTLQDGSIQLRIKRQYNSYDCGEYLQ